MKRLLLTRKFPDANIAAAQAHFDVTVMDREEGLTPDEAKDALMNYDAILATLGDQFSAAAFAEPTRCKMIGNFGVGYNHIDVEAAQAAGVSVSNTPEVVTDATADIAMTLILATCRRAGEGERLVRAGKWDGWTPTFMLGTHVTGKTLGIVGMGRIGQAVARRAHFGFEMPIKYFNRSQKSVDFPATQVETLNQLMSDCDIIVVTVPGGGANTQLINREALDAMKPTGIFVNVARGDVVDEDALIDVLEAGQIAGAGLDVFEKEPFVPERLRALENAVLLPHLGTSALEVREQMGQMALDNILAWSKGETPPQLV